MISLMLYAVWPREFGKAITSVLTESSDKLVANYAHLCVRSYRAYFSGVYFKFHNNFRYK